MTFVCLSSCTINNEIPFEISSWQKRRERRRNFALSSIHCNAQRYRWPFSLFLGNCRKSVRKLWEICGKISGWPAVYKSAIPTPSALQRQADCRREWQDRAAKKKKKQKGQAATKRTKVFTSKLNFTFTPETNDRDPVRIFSLFCPVLGFFFFFCGAASLFWQLYTEIRVTKCAAHKPKDARLQHPRTSLSGTQAESPENPSIHPIPSLPCPHVSFRASIVFPAVRGFPPTKGTLFKKLWSLYANIYKCLTEYPIEWASVII